MKRFDRWGNLLGRAPQGARGLKYRIRSVYGLALSVAPRKGRVG